MQVMLPQGGMVKLITVSYPFGYPMLNHLITINEKIIIDPYAGARSTGGLGAVPG